MKTKLLETAIRNNSLILTVLAQELGFKEAPALEEVICNMFDCRDEKHVVIDLSNVEYVNSVGVSLLVMVKRELESNNMELSVVCNNKAILQVLQVLHIDSFFNIYPSLEDVFEMNNTARCA